MYFLCNIHHSLLGLGTVTNTSVQCLGTILNRHITIKSEKKVTERTLIYSMRAETRRQNVPLFNLCILGTQILCHAHVH
jgi:hypothetical protein